MTFHEGRLFVHKKPNKIGHLFLRTFTSHHFANKKYMARFIEITRTKKNLA